MGRLEEHLRAASATHHLLMVASTDAHNVINYYMSCPRLGLHPRHAILSIRVICVGIRSIVGPTTAARRVHKHVAFHLTR